MRSHLRCLNLFYLTEHLFHKKFSLDRDIIHLLGTVCTISCDVFLHCESYTIPVNVWSFWFQANDISCTCVSFNKRWIVTADKGKDNLIIVWDSSSGFVFNWSISQTTSSIPSDVKWLNCYYNCNKNNYLYSSSFIKVKVYSCIATTVDFCFHCLITTFPKVSLFQSIALVIRQNKSIILLHL